MVQERALRLTRGQRVGRFVGRLPRRVAYPLILILSVVLWTPIAIAGVRLAEWIHALLP